MFRYRNDEQRIKESVLSSKDFAKQFYFEKLKLLTDEHSTNFENLNFIQFKGTDILKRQIFFLHLDRISLYDIDNEHLSDHFIIYLSNCNYFIKNNYIYKNNFLFIFSSFQFILFI